MNFSKFRRFLYFHFNYSFKFFYRAFSDPTIHMNLNLYETSALQRSLNFECDVHRINQQQQQQHQQPQRMFDRSANVEQPSYLTMTKRNYSSNDMLVSSSLSSSPVAAAAIATNNMQISRPQQCSSRSSSTASSPCQSSQQYIYITCSSNTNNNNCNSNNDNNNLRAISTLTTPFTSIIDTSQSAPTSPLQYNAEIPTLISSWPSRNFSNSPDSLEIPNIVLTGTDGQLDCFQDLQDLHLDVNEIQQLLNNSNEVDGICETQLFH